MTALRQRSTFAAAAHVLRAPSMRWIVDGKINDSSETILWEDIRSHYRNMSTGEQSLYDIAFAIWRDDPVSINLVLLDEASLERVYEALLALRPLANVRSATDIAQEAIGMFLERMDAAGVYLCERSGGDSYEDADKDDIAEIRHEAVQEIREGMAVREEDIR
jgi:hypothetical protein